MFNIKGTSNTATDAKAAAEMFKQGNWSMQDLKEWYLKNLPEEHQTRAQAEKDFDKWTKTLATLSGGLAGIGTAAAGIATTWAVINYLIPLMIAKGCGLFLCYFVYYFLVLGGNLLSLVGGVIAFSKTNDAILKARVAKRADVWATIK